MRGPSPAFAACWRSRPQPLARPPRSPSLLRRPPTRRPWHVRLQPLTRPSCSPLRLRRPSAMRPVPAPGPPPVSAACRGPRPGPRRGSPRSPLPARLGGAGRQGLAAWAAGAAVPARPGSRAGGGGPTSNAASASLRSSRSARVSPVHSGEETGERERDRRWWRSSRWRDPSESAITVILVGMRGGRRALPTTSWCISAVPWAVPCGALRGGGGEGVGGRLWLQPRAAGGLRPSTGIGRGGGGATRPTRRTTAPSLGRG